MAAKNRRRARERDDAKVREDQQLNRAIAWASAVVVFACVWVYYFMTRETMTEALLMSWFPAGAAAGATWAIMNAAWRWALGFIAIAAVAGIGVLIYYRV